MFVVQNGCLDFVPVGIAQQFGDTHSPRFKSIDF